MKRNGALKRKTGLRQKSPMRRSNASKAAFSAETRAAALRRSGGRCEALTPVCRDKASHLHHIRLRKSGDASLENALYVCCACHTYIHSNVAESYERGWLKRSN